jgi:hypothetical protein
MKSVLSTKKHEKARRTYAQHGLNDCEFIVTHPKSVLSIEKHVLNTDLASVSECQTVN